MAFSPSVGDILMLSQLAWRLGRAFAQGKNKSPPEFADIERESNGLSESLKMVAETLYSDSSILTKANDNTRLAVSTILDSAQKTLSDLESSVERFRVIRKKETKTGFVVERAWSDIVIANYKTLEWTSEGGDIVQLRNLLHMHTNTISLTMQAMQSRSLDRLERTVIPLANSIASVHDRGSGDLGMRIDNFHRVIMDIANGTPSLDAADRDLRSRQSSVDSSDTVSSVSALSHSPTSPVSQRSAVSELAPPRIPARNPARPLSPLPAESPAKTPRSMREDSAYFSMERAPKGYDSRRMDAGFESGSPPPDRASIGATYSMPPSGSTFPIPPSGLSYSVPPSGSTAVATPSQNPYIQSWQQEPQYPRRESLTVPRLFSAYDDDKSDTDAGAPYVPEATPVSPFSKKDIYYPPSRQDLPPPALPPDVSPNPRTPATPSSFFGRPKRADSNLEVSTPRPTTAHSVKKRDSAKSDSSPVINPTAQSFEKALFRNAAILCDVRGSLVEYAKHIPDEPDPRYNTEMVKACKECRVYVIRKRENRPHGGTKVISSIWAISDDGTTRVQQRLPDDSETVPYCSYFQPEKVSLPPTDGDMKLRFHAEAWGEEIQKECSSNWINYVFENEEAANNFQSAIFGRTLLGSFRTTKTTVIHEGFKGAFAFEEQFANIEVLRFWEDDGIATAGAGGGVLALMHLGSNFGEGWARWWMNSSKQQVRVKDEQTKFARIKGIDIRTVKPGEKYRQASVSGESGAAAQAAAQQRNNKKNPEKRVTGVRIEFKTEEERAKFVLLVKRVQERMLPLPDV